MTRKEEYISFVNALQPNFLNDPEFICTLESIGYFDVPASTRFHGTNRGDLFRHSKAVAETLLEYTERLDLPWERESSPYIIGLLHDLCKTAIYMEQNGEWIKLENDTRHAELSLDLLDILNVQLTDEERLCIRWHMGAFDSKENWEKYTEAVKKNPNVLYTHTADMFVSQFLRL